MDFNIRFPSPLTSPNTVSSLPSNIIFFNRGSLFRTDNWGCLTDACRRFWIGTKRRGASGRVWSAAASPESPLLRWRHGSRSTNATIQGYSRGRSGTGWSRRESATERAPQASRRSPGFWEAAILRTRQNLATVSFSAFRSSFLPFPSSINEIHSAKKCVKSFDALLDFLSASCFLQK